MNKNKIYNVDIISKSEDAAIQDQRVLSFHGSTAAADRDDEIVTADGWEIDNYLKNPVFLFGHRYDEPPIGKALNVTMTPNGLDFDIKFADKETYPFADTIYRLYKGGFMRAVSVGFIGKEYVIDPKEQKRKITRKELLELSAVPVPANPEALVQSFDAARTKGIISQDEYDRVMKYAAQTKPEPEITDKYIRIRIREPELFIEETFRTIDIDADRGIKSVVGKLKADGQDGSMVIQNYMFDKEKWTLDQAASWVKDHEKEDQKAIDEFITAASNLYETILGKSRKDSVCRCASCNGNDLEAISKVIKDIKTLKE